MGVSSLVFNHMVVDGGQGPVHLEREALDLMTAWIERYRRRAEERYRRLDDVLASMPDDVDPMPPTGGGAPT